METNFKSYVVIASFLLAFGAMLVMPTSSTARGFASGPTIDLCPGTGATCATANSNGTTITMYKGASSPGGTVKL